jgi:hypothetical protein
MNLRVIAVAEVRDADGALVTTGGAGGVLAAVAVALADEARAAHVDTVGAGQGVGLLRARRRKLVNIP